jgi:hypothetical protein
MLGVKRFNVTKGINNEFIFNIKKSHSIEAMSISSSDTFTANIIDLDTEEVVLSKPLHVVNAIGGKVGLTITANESSSLNKEVGTHADRYYNIATYRIMLKAVTAANGEFTAHIGKVYVK